MDDDNSIVRSTSNNFQPQNFMNNPNFVSSNNNEGGKQTNSKLISNFVASSVNSIPTNNNTSQVVYGKVNPNLNNPNYNENNNHGNQHNQNRQFNEYSNNYHGGNRKYDNNNNQYNQSTS
jgi:hypothetical protein